MQVGPPGFAFRRRGVGGEEAKLTARLGGVGRGACTEGRTGDGTGFGPVNPDVWSGGAYRSQVGRQIWESVGSK